MKAPTKKSTANQRTEHNVEKYIRWVIQRCRWQYGTIFIRLAVIVAPKTCAIPWNSPKIRTLAVQGHPWVIDLGANRKISATYNFLFLLHKLSSLRGHRCFAYKQLVA